MKNSKWCWLAKEVKNGWKVYLEIGNTTFKSNKKSIKTIKSVENFCSSIGGNIVFIHLKNTKYPVK